MINFIKYPTYKYIISLPTTLNKMIATASLTIPYPNIIENILGNSDDLIKVKAATESVADMVALYLIIKVVYKCSILFYDRNGMIQCN